MKWTRRGFVTLHEKFVIIVPLSADFERGSQLTTACTDTDGLSQHLYRLVTNIQSKMATNNDKIQFRGEAEKEATQIVDQMRLGGINISELARQGLREKLQEALSDEEKITLHQRYKQGELSDEVAEILLGDAIEEIEREREAFEEASELDRTGVFQQ